MVGECSEEERESTRAQERKRSRRNRERNINAGAHGLRDTNAMEKRSEENAVRETREHTGSGTQYAVENAVGNAGGKGRQLTELYVVKQYHSG